MKTARTTILLLLFIAPAFCYSQSADFNFSTPNGLFCNPQAVTFTQNCTGSPQNFLWSFGNGQVSTSGSAVVTYVNPGTYSVTLTAIYATNAVSVTKTVTINPTPTISLNADRTYICQPGVINFTAPGSAFTTSFEWDFGDGTGVVTTATNSIAHSFAAYGNYTVTVKGTTPEGCSATASLAVKVEKFAILNPVVTPSEGCIPISASFSAGVNLPVGDAPANFAWDFGDGSPISNTASGTTSHLYNITAQISTASVLITSAQGCTNQYNFPTFAYGTPPYNTSIVTADGRSTYCASDIITFNAASVNANKYVIDFGDGNQQTTMSGTLSYRYRSLGPMRVVVTPYFNGCRGETDYIDLTIVGVVADYTFANSCGAKSTYNYTNQSAGNITSFSWSFSDSPGTPDVVNFNPTHTFPPVGSFTTLLNVHDAVTGCSDAYTTNQYTAIPLFKSSASAVCKDSMITYSIATGYPPLSGYTYSFHVAGTVINTGITSFIQFPPAAHGIFNDTVIISGPTPGTCDDTLVLSNQTKVRGPLLDFSLPDSLCQKNNSFPITNNSAPFFPGENIISWNWDFSDGTTSNQQVPPPHQFIYAGSYWVRLKATDVNGCSQSDSTLVTVVPTPLLAVFPLLDTLCAGQSMHIYAYTADTLLWTTNYNIDCVTCDTALINPLVTTAYIATATNELGCMNTDTSFIRVYAPINLQVSPADTSICPGGRVQYRSNVNGVFTWTPSTFLNSATIRNPVSRPDTAISYEIIVTDSAGCFADTTMARINIYDPPTVDAGPDQVIPFNNPFTISPVYSANADSYLWTPSTNSLSCTTCPVITGTAQESTLYRIEVTTENSCKASDEIKIIVACSKANLNLPSGFTPNNDGRNDRFYPMTRGYSIINKLIIFDRWGNKVFERYNFAPNSPALGWNGATKDGQISSTAVYVWIMEATCDAGELVQTKGTVTVIR